MAPRLRGSDDEAEWWREKREREDRRNEMGLASA